ncbi:hypothetical protein OOT46_03785 [Aquabacterium sp. A7-Y]|uniref:hypothetical protein n=1 Tax=Aquabacterium sp. A7-Y TaxID=1349605 RepID=UPI00223E3B79|nr:hypothetical protein [Aquabacterium sp. A7-Y]MCW7536974.1 hypothetical protein [Aquabacterium sp. A7-Y]
MNMSFRSIQGAPQPASPQVRATTLQTEAGGKDPLGRQQLLPGNDARKRTGEHQWTHFASAMRQHHAHAADAPGAPGAGAAANRARSAQRAADRWRDLFGARGGRRLQAQSLKLQELASQGEAALDHFLDQEHPDALERLLLLQVAAGRAEQNGEDTRVLDGAIERTHARSGDVLAAFEATAEGSKAQAAQDAAAGVQLRSLYDSLGGDAKEGGLKSGEVLRALLKQLGTMDFDRAFDTLHKGTLSGLKGRPAASAEQRVMAAMNDAWAFANARSVMATASDMKARLESAGAKVERGVPELASSLLEAADSAATDALRLMLSVSNERIVEQRPQLARGLAALRDAVAVLPLTLWPAHRLDARVGLLGSIDQLAAESGAPRGRSDAAGLEKALRAPRGA